MADNIEAIYVKNISEFLERNKVPIVPAIKANGFVFVSGAPPIDPGNLNKNSSPVLEYSSAISAVFDESIPAPQTN